MMARSGRALVLGAVALVAAAASRRLAYAQAQPQQTPKGWSYDTHKNGQRVPKGNRVTNPDGSWREEVKPGQLRDRQGEVGRWRV